MVTGFISASAIVIASSQLGNLLGIDVDNASFFNVVASTVKLIDQTHVTTLLLGLGSIAFLFIVPKIIRALVLMFSSSAFVADSLSKTAPILAMLGSILVVVLLDLEHQDVVLLGHIPQGLPALQLPDLQQLEWSLATWKSLFSSALLISIIGFVSSLSAAQAFATKQRQRINPDQEAISLELLTCLLGFPGLFRWRPAFHAQQ